MSSILYRYGSTYYINMTNRCPCRCVFCIRSRVDGLGSADSLWLEREPTPEEILLEIEVAGIDKSQEIVFCGYGEPTERFDDLLATARMIKERIGCKLRLDTNGLGNLINGRDIVPEMIGQIDSVSISLNASNPEEYVEVTRCRYGTDGYVALLRFIIDCKASIGRVIVSVVGGSISPESEGRCRRMAEDWNVGFRVR